MWAGALRIGKAALTAIALVVAFAASLSLSVLVHADLPLARRVAARLASDALSSTLGGKVEIATISHIDLSRITVPTVTLFDAYSTRVLSLEDVRVDVSLRRIAEQLLASRSVLTIFVSHLRVERADVTLVADPTTGEPTIARAIALRAHPGAAPPATGVPSAPSARVYLPVIELGVVRAHGRLSGQAPFEADVHDVQGLLLANNRGLAVDVRRFGVALRGGGFDARGTGTLAVRAPGPVRGTFEGFFGDIEIKSSAFIDGSRVVGSFDAPRVTPEAARRIVPAWPLQVPVSAHVDASGNLPDLTVVASLDAQGATIEGTGSVHLAVPQTATFFVSSHHLNAQLLWPDAPTTDLALDVHGTARVDAGRISADVEAHTETTAISGELVPEIDAKGSWKDDAASGTAEIREPGLPVTASWTASRAGVVDVDAHVGPFNLERLPRLPIPGIAGRGQGRLRAHIADGKARATFEADVSHFAAPGAALERAHVTAQLSAPLRALPQATANVHVAGDGLTAGTFVAKTVVLDARGTPRNLAFEAKAKADGATEFHATGTAAFAERLVVSGTKVQLRRDPVVIEGTVEAWDPSEGRLDVRDIHVAGAGGTLTGSARLGRDLVEVDANGENIDLGAVGRALGLPRGTIEGTLRLDASVAVGHDVTRGRVRVALGNATLGMVSGLSAQGSADLEDTHITGGASGLVLGLGTFGTTWDATLGGPAFEPTSWRDVVGHGEVEIGNVQLPLLSIAIPKSSPVGNLGGEAFARILLSRTSDKDRLPEVFATVATRGFSFDVRHGEKPTHVTGIDVTATGAFSGKTGVSNGTTLVSDKIGALASASGAIQVDVDKLLADPARALSQLLDTPIDFVVSVPQRKIAELPELIRPAGVGGVVSGNATVRGTLVKPTLFASIDGLAIGAADAPLSRPVDVHASGQYEWDSREISARASTSLDGREVATGTFRGVIPTGSLAEWTGDGRADLNGLPLDLLSAVAKNDVTGQLVGSAAIRKSGAGGEVAADIRLDNAAVGGAPLGPGRLHVESAGTTVRGNVAFTGERGTLNADASTSVTWAEGFPTPADDAPRKAHVVAHEFSAVAILPFVRPILSRIGGRLDADLTVSTLPKRTGAEGTTPSSTTIEGAAALSSGSALVETLGLDVRDLSVSLRARPEGRDTVITVSDLTGRVRSSSDNLSGNAELVLDDLRLSRGTGQLQANDLPILFRGAPQGRITGGAGLRLSRDDAGYLLDMDVPKLVATLPQTSTRNVIELSENPDIVVTQLSHDEAPRGDVTPWRIALHLGNDVRVKRSDIDLGVTGTPVLELGPTTSMDGSIDLMPGSRVPALSQVFLVETGRIVFDTGEPTNPRLEVTAAWRSASGTVVHVDLTGTLRDPKLALRSDPPLPQSEIAALVLGGESSASDQASTTSGADSGAGAGAVALGTGVAAIGVNQLLTNNPVQLRVETTSESRPRYTAAVRVRENLWFEASTYQQTQMVSESGGTDRSVYSGTVDYRFSPRWSLRTEAGTVGGALDLLWQYRY